jgi:hypothetical protein
MLKKIPILLLVIIGVACKKETKSVSHIQIHEVEDFVVSSIQEGDNSNLYCVGLKRNGNEIIVKKFNESLELVESTNLSEISEFSGNLFVTHLQNNGWLISSFKEGQNPKLTVYRTDEDFNIQDEAKIGSNHDSSFKATVRELRPLKNGDFILAYDSVDPRGLSTRFQGIKIIRLDQQLDEVFSFTGPFYSNTGHFSPRLVELPDESIFYSIATNTVDGQGLYTEFSSGVINKSGVPLWDTISVDKRRIIHPISLSYNGSNIIRAYRVNLEVLTYDLLDPKTGNVIGQSTLNTSLVNHHNDYGVYLNYFPFNNEFFFSGEANGLSKELGDNAGHVLHYKPTEKLYFMGVDNDLNLERRFVLNLPEFQEIQSYRQLITDKGTIMIGVSYLYKKKHYFTLMEVDENGNILQ